MINKFEDVMTYEDKLDLIVKAIFEARKLTRKGHGTKLYLTADNGLKNLNTHEIYDILLKLQDDEEILSVQDIPSAIKSLTDISDALEGKKEFFLLEIKDIFDRWYEGYVLKQKSRLGNLDWINLLKALDVALDINGKLQIANSTTVRIPSLPSLVRFALLFPQDSIGTRRIYQDYRGEGVKYLSNMGVVLEFEYIEDYSGGYGDIEVVVDLLKFETLLKELTEEYKKRENATPKPETKNKKTDEDGKKATSKQPEEKSDVVYEITYTKQRQILMNNAQIGKPDFNSENDLVFDYLYKHPNESFTKEQIEKAIGVKLNKSLHKIVENLGFEGDTKEVFISVSKNAIQFRNPITKRDLEEMKKPLIKLIKGGGKLILPH